MEFTKKPQSSVLQRQPQAVQVAQPAPALRRQALIQRDVQRHTLRPVAVQRRVAAPALKAAELHSAELQRLSTERASMQRQAAEINLPQSAVQAALQRQSQAVVAQTMPAKPQSVGDWVTVMRMQAEQTTDRRMGAKEVAQFTALQRQVAQTMTRGYMTDRQPALQRQKDYAGHVLALQRHPASGNVARAFMLGVPNSERLALQRAVDEAQLDEKIQRQQDEEALRLHSLQRQMAELDQQAAQPVFERIQQRRGAGNPLPEAILRHLERGLNHDLSAVRIHDDAEADKLAKKVNAVAFTTGTDIYFQSGKFNPNSQSGLELLAHEVTHTVQQSKGKVGKGVDPDAGLESEARATGRRLATLKPGHSRLKARKQPSGSVTGIKTQIMQRQAAPMSLSPSIDQRKLQQLRQLLSEYHQLQKAGQISATEAQKVRQAVERANSAIRSAEGLAGQGASLRVGAAGALATAGGLAADDVTVIGVADDVLIPFVLIAAGGMYLLGRGRTPSAKTQNDAWQRAEVAVSAAVATVGATVNMAKKSKARTRTDAPAVPIATTQTQERKPEEHRGRLQVQGVDMDNFPNGEISWAWTRTAPPTLVESVAALHALKAQLNKSQLKIRIQAFIEAEAFLIQAHANGGAWAPISKSFPKDLSTLPRGMKSARVDVEVKKGKAFV